MSFSNLTLLSKCQRFDDSRIKKKRARIYTKHQQIDRNRDQEKKDLANYNGDRYRYISFFYYLNVITFL